MLNDIKDSKMDQESRRRGSTNVDKRTERMDLTGRFCDGGDVVLNRSAVVT